MTEEWLFNLYGSSESGQMEQTKQWLLTYGARVTSELAEEWKKWKHLSEYQVNTIDIVLQVISRINTEFESELQAHRFINLLRVPIAIAYEQALEIVKPKIILELGVGGDSAISTAIFLAYCEKNQAKLFSVDKNPLNKAAERYRTYMECENPIWGFEYSDSIQFLIKRLGEKTNLDMIFIDTIHSYQHTIEEITYASELTDNILLDDALFEGNEGDSIPGGVKKAIEEWIGQYGNIWIKTEFWNGGVVLLRKINEKLAKICN